MIIPLLITYLGIACGVAIGKIAEEELKDGERYFKALQGIIIGGIVFFVTVFFLQNLYYGAAAGIIVGSASFFWISKVSPRATARASYILLALPFFFAYKAGLKYPSLVIFQAIASLIFIYGFPTGSLLLKAKVPLTRIFLCASPFIIISLILYFTVKTLPF